MEAGPLIYALPIQTVHRGDNGLIWNGLDTTAYFTLAVWPRLNLKRGFTSPTIPLFPGGAPVSQAVDRSPETSSTLAILRRRHPQLLCSLAWLALAQVTFRFRDHRNDHHDHHEHRDDHCNHCDNDRLIVTREQIRELGTRESEVQRIFAGLRQAVSSKVFLIRLVSLLSSFWSSFSSDWFHCDHFVE